MSSDRDTVDAEERKRKAEDRRRQHVEDFKHVVSDERGRRFMWNLLGDCGVFRTSFRNSSEMAFLEGQRNIGLKLIDLIHAESPETYLLMLQEQRKNV